LSALLNWLKPAYSLLWQGKMHHTLDYYYPEQLQEGIKCAKAKE
jgi:hypothetical protein